uniref:Uncharacterized protein LOC105113285 n=1 Tax=Rhizophora mucronata TaxID=61149 RepID=A0A2P2LNL7_RHIMU
MVCERNWITSEPTWNSCFSTWGSNTVLQLPGCHVSG